MYSKERKNPFIISARYKSLGSSSLVYTKGYSWTVCVAIARRSAYFSLGIEYQPVVKRKSNSLNEFFANAVFKELFWIHLHVLTVISLIVLTLITPTSNIINSTDPYY